MSFSKDIRDAVLRRIGLRFTTHLSHCPISILFVRVFVCFFVFLHISGIGFAHQQVALFMSLSLLEQRFFKGSALGMLTSLIFMDSMLLVPGFYMRVSLRRWVVAGASADSPATERGGLDFLTSCRYTHVALVRI